MSLSWRDPARLRRALVLCVLVGSREVAAQALAGGATAIQLRHKTLSGRDLCALGSALAELCAAAGALLLVNDRLDVALACGAGGVHLGQDDIPAGLARAVAGPGLVLGVSAATPAEAAAAQRAGADYLGTGPVYATGSKGDAGEPIGPAGLRRVAAASALPLVGIGGLDATNAGAAIAAGADGVAVISAVAAAPDLALAAAGLAAAVRAGLAARGAGRS